MNGGSTTRAPRRSRPGVEGLEERMLLDAGAGTDAEVAALAAPKAKATSDAVKRFAYTLPQGGRVVINLYGTGTLKGTFVDPDGALNLRFSGTNEQTGIVGQVHGGTGFAPIRTMGHLGIPLDSISGIGGTLVRVVNLNQFDLVEGGRINLAAGVNTFFLNSAAPSSSVQMREIPAQLLTSSTSSATQNGVTVGFALDVTGARTLTTTSGTFVAGFNLFPTTLSTKPNTQFAPPGIIASIRTVNGPSRATGIGPSQVYGYNPDTDELVRFDIVFDPTANGGKGAYVGAPTVARTNVLGMTGVEAGVSIGRNAGKSVVLVSDGQNVRAFSALDASPVGSFSVANLAASSDMPNPTRLGTVDSFTVIGDPTAPSTTGLGLVQILNLTQSLATGQAVTVGTPFAATREFGLSGGLAGVPGYATLYAGGGGHFDTFVPDDYQLGVASVTASNGGLRESARNALTVGGARVTTNSRGGTSASANDAMGSFGTNLSIVTGVVDGKTEVTLFNPQTFARTGKVSLDYTGKLSGLSPVYRSALVDSVLVDVQGNIQSFRSVSTQGLVLNDTGNLNLAKIHRAVDTTIIGNPFGHAIIPQRENVAIFSSNTRNVAGRNGVTIVPDGVQPTGPLQIP